MKRRKRILVQVGALVLVLFALTALVNGVFIYRSSSEDYLGILDSHTEHRHSPAVATMEGTRFREHEFQLHPGDALFVYTDGVTKATNANNELFGEDRVVEALNLNPNASPREILQTVKDAIDGFVGDAVQFDDITMLGLDYFG